MALSPGDRLGSYEIVSALGAGGMGEVYRARDAKLDRDVALKILPSSVAADPERLARFTREAKTLASLNHPHIAHILGLEDSGEVHALVMELVEGEDLTQLIARGAIPLDETLAIARQIIAALEAAHEQGIVHRDLKPANIRLGRSGSGSAEPVVKVLDFGLAKVLESRTETELAATVTSADLTKQGSVVGTAAYMSPEQARGQAVDKRSDIWAFGCVLFEMLTAKKAFGGDSASDAIAATLTAEPDWSALPGNTPTHIRTLLRRSLQRNLRLRLRDIGDAQIDVDAVTIGAEDDADRSVRSRRSSWSSHVVPWAVAAAALSAALAAWAPWRQAVIIAPVHLTAGLGADVSVATTRSSGNASAILSPDGTRLAFAGEKADGTSQLYIRSLAQTRAVPVADTSGARSPFFSPDGQWVAFFADGQLKKVSATGGAVVRLADAPDPRGGTWAEDGTIAFVPGGRDGSNLWRISAAGENLTVLTTLADGEVTQRWPQFLPGKRAVLFTSSTKVGDFSDATLVVHALPNGKRSVVQAGGYYGRYLASGHLAFVRDNTLFAAPFDLDRLEVSGPAVPVVERVATIAGTGGAQFDVSANGTLVYLTAERDELPLYWMDRRGATSALRSTPANASQVVIAPDGRRLAMTISDGGRSDVWLYDWASDSVSRFTFDQMSGTPVWSPDGRRITFASRRGDNVTNNLYWQRVDGTGDATRLTNSPNNQRPRSWDPSGRFLAFEENRQSTDIMILPMNGDEAAGWNPGPPRVFLNSPAHEVGGVFSPDGQWLAYAMNEKALFDVYVQPFPPTGGKWLVSAGGGSFPRWSRSRPELFYATPEQRIMVVPYSQDRGSFRPDKPRLLSQVRFASGRGNFDLHPDGERLAMFLQPARTIDGEGAVTLVFNVFDELRRRAPSAALP